MNSPLRLFCVLRSMFYIAANRLVYLRQHVKFGNHLTLRGLLYIRSKGICSIGDNSIINSSFKANPIGCGTKTVIRVSRFGSLLIGKNCKISNSAFISDESHIEIGDYVHIGSGCRFYAHNFHSLNPYLRASVPEDPRYVRKGPIKIDDHAFIGADCIILQNVSIGRNSVVGAGSVVRCKIPANEVWAGNPAVKIRDLKETELQK